MAIQRHLRKVGAHPNQETQPCDLPSSRPTVAPDSQQQPPPTGRKRKRRTLSPQQQDSQPKKPTQPSKRQRKSESSPQPAQRLVWEKPSPLCRSTLKDFDHRNALLAKEAPQQVGEGQNQVCPATVEEFARDGGPDLSGLRQYPESSILTENSDSMPSRRDTRSGRTDTTRLSAYSTGFGPKLKDNGIFLPDPNIRAANDREWNEVLIQPRPSLSPSRMSDGHHRRFVSAVYRAQDEDEVMTKVHPEIVGRDRYPSGQNVRFGNLAPLADGLVVPKPDYYEGEDAGEGNRQLRGQLSTYIVPHEDRDIFLPNFFTEAKGPDGTPRVARLQAAHDGAIGARAMHRTENHGRRQERFDNKARTVTSILDGAGHLDIFSHHVSKPTGRGALPKTYMTPLRSYSLTDSPESYRQGVGAYRNASDHAHHHRTESIKNAHRRSKIISPRPLSISPRSTLTPLSCQNHVAESSGSDTDTSSEAEDSDGSDHRASSRGRAKGKTLKPKVVFASPQRPAKRGSSPPRRELRPRRPRR